MKKNKLYNALLGVLLMVPGQVMCSELPQGIREHLWLSVPAAPEWMTNFTSGLSDTKKYFLYGALTAFLGYIGYKAFKATYAVPAVSETEKDTEFFLKDANLDQLDSYNNILNIKLLAARTYTSILSDGSINGRDYNKDQFKKRVCPILTQFSQKLQTKEGWDTFLPKLAISTTDRIHFGFEDLNAMQMGYGLHQMMKNTCPNREIMDPLKALLIERNPKDTKLLEILNK
jgi:hypothetical protein